MTCETKETIINGHKYSYTQLPASKSLVLKFKLAGMLGGTIAKLIPAIGKPEEEQMIDFADAIAEICSRNEPEKMVELIKEILIPAFMDGERIEIDKHFTNSTTEIYKVLMWALSVEYGDFLKGVGSMKKQTPNPESTSSKKPLT